MKQLFISLSIVLLASPSIARRPAEPIRTAEPINHVGVRDGILQKDARFAIAAPNTTTLASFTFDSGGACTAEGWTATDLTAQPGVFWHVDDFAGVNVNPGDSYAALAGAKSLWCGLRANSVGLPCGYLVLPGYGNNWNQVWQTKACVPVVGNLDVSFLMELDSEQGYDATFLEYSTVCVDPEPVTDWVVLDGGINDWDGAQTITHSQSYAVGGSPVRVRLRFQSDGGFSDEDANFDSHAGPVVIDNLTAEGLPLEDFEGEAVDATSSNDWEADVMPGYGSYFALFPGTLLVQDKDACAKNLTCMWAAIAGSPFNYACGGFPQQATVPYGNSQGQYINSAIESPLIPLTGNGSVINLQYSLYGDHGANDLIFHTWDVRSVASGCASRWQSRGFIFFIPTRGWFVNTHAIGDLIPGAASYLQVRLAVIDLCGVWCGVVGTGACHSHAPLFDSVKVYRVDIVGPVWSTRDIDMFQDTFPTDGTATGIGRADAALSITGSASPTILPGDSTRVVVRDPLTAVVGLNPSGLATDVLGGNNGNKACYVWVHVIDSGAFNPAKSGAVLSGGPLYPFKDTVLVNGKTWTRIQCWLRTVSTSTFVVDLNDNLLQAGDVIEFFFSGTNTNGQTSYCSGSSLTYVQSDINLAAEAAAEFSILPLDTPTDILYVDGVDGRGAQVFWDTAFEQLAIDPQRYDVRGPTSSVSNRPGSRVTNVAQQLNAKYKFILWDSGDLTQNLGDGTGAPEKSNDYAMVNTFLVGLTSTGGIYVCGDDYPAGLNVAAGASAVTFKTTYMTYSLFSSNHRPTYGTSPTGVGIAGGAFVGDTFAIYGGCPLINDFDVITPSGSSLKQVAYNNAGNQAAVVSKATGNARVMISGFSFIYLRDDEEDGIMDRADHLHDILTFLGGSPSPPTDADPAAFANRLEQNYPNPFNPQTTIAFSLKARSHVRIDVFDVTGAHVRGLLDETRAAGSYGDVRWDGRDGGGRVVASGVYFYKLMTDGFEQTRKMVLLK